MASSVAVNTLSLLFDRRFWPLFWVQFLVAFNDNVLKMGLVLMVTYGEDLFGAPVTLFGLGAGPLNAAGGLLLMVPFFLFSATAGQVADRFAKHRVMRVVKLAEVVLMLFALVGFGVAAQGFPTLAGAGLLVLLFFMGTQSAAFGPVKYSILPQLLPEPGELVSGNALVELGTYLSVLVAGVIATGLFLLPRQLGLPPASGLWVIGGSVVVFSLLGWLAARANLPVPAERPELKVSWEPVTTTWKVVRIVWRRGDLLFAVLANSWFWALGAAMITLLPTWTANALYADETVFMVFSALFSVGIGLGSVLCARLSRGRLEMGLVLVGGVGITLFLLDLTLGGGNWAPLPVDAPRRTLLEVLSSFWGWRIVVDLLGLAASGGFFMVPLYTYLQHRGESGERGSIIGALNVVNAGFIVGALAVVMGLLAAGVPERWIFLGLGLVNAGWVLATWFALPLAAMRYTAQILANLFWRFEVVGAGNIPEEGPALLICNHVSYMDWLLLMAAVQRRHRFVIWHEFAALPVASTLTRQYQVIPITNDPKERKLILSAFKEISRTLKEGNLVVVFPEGALPYASELQPFMRGLTMILKRDPVPVVPMAINGMWGSPYSRKGGQAFRSFRGPWRRVRLTIGEPLDPEGLTLDDMQDAVEALWKAHPDRP